MFLYEHLHYISIPCVLEKTGEYETCFSPQRTAIFILILYLLF